MKPILFILAIFITMSLYFSLDKRSEQSIPDCECQKKIDSLESELQDLTISNTRYEIIMEKIAEVDSVLLMDAMNNVE